MTETRSRSRKVLDACLAPRATLRSARDRARERLTPQLLRRLGWIAIALTITGLSLIGLFSLTRGTPIERVRRGGATGVPAIGDPSFVPTVELYTGASFRPGNSIEILTNGDGTYPALWRDLRAAERTITFQTYFAQPGGLADTLARILVERAKHGVRVLLLLDAFGSQTIRTRWLDSLRALGVEAERYRELEWYKVDQLGSRSHVRAVVVDGVVGHTGGFGIADYWLGDGRHRDQWRETNARFRGPAVAQLQAAFATAWAESTGELLAGASFFPNSDGESAGAAVAALAFTPPPTGSTPAERFMALTIAGARRTLYIANSYFLPDDDFRRFLKDAAQGGVDVRVLTAAGDQTDLKTVFYASHARYAELLRAGIRIYEYNPAMMHAKTVVADGMWTAIGSMNFDNRSLALNSEANLLVLDAAIGARMDSLFLDDLDHSTEITLAAFDRRPLWQRVLEHGANLLSRVL